MMKRSMMNSMMILMMKMIRMSKKRNLLQKSIIPPNSKSLKETNLNINKITSLNSKISHNIKIINLLITVIINNIKVESPLTKEESLTISVENPIISEENPITLVESPITSVENPTEESPMVESLMEENHSTREESLSIKVAEIDYDYRFI